MIDFVLESMDLMLVSRLLVLKCRCCGWRVFVLRVVLVWVM